MDTTDNMNDHTEEYSNIPTVADGIIQHALKFEKVFVVHLENDEEDENKIVFFSKELAEEYIEFKQDILKFNKDLSQLGWFEEILDAFHIDKNNKHFLELKKSWTNENKWMGENNFRIFLKRLGNNESDDMIIDSIETSISETIASSYWFTLNATYIMESKLNEQIEK